MQRNPKENTMQRAAREAQLEEILRAPETNGIVRQSELSLSDTELEQLEMLMSQTKTHYPTQEIPPETLEIWVPLWIKMTEKYGLAAMKTVLWEHMDGDSPFFPHPSQIRAQLRQQQATKGPSLVTVPMTRREKVRLIGPERAASITEETEESVRTVYGKEAARLFQAKLDAELEGESST
jgi:hypothetical protein